MSAMLRELSISSQNFFQCQALTLLPIFANTQDSLVTMKEIIWAKLQWIHYLQENPHKFLLTL